MQGEGWSGVMPVTGAEESEEAAGAKPQEELWLLPGYAARNSALPEALSLNPQRTTLSQTALSRRPPPPVSRRHPTPAAALQALLRPLLPFPPRPLDRAPTQHWGCPHRGLATNLQLPREISPTCSTLPQPRRCPRPGTLNQCDGAAGG